MSYLGSRHPATSSCVRWPASRRRLFWLALLVTTLLSGAPAAPTAFAIDDDMGTALSFSPSEPLRAAGETGHATCTKAGAIANARFLYAIGNCMPGWTIAIAQRSGPDGSGNRFFGGFVGQNFQGCGWIRTSALGEPYGTPTSHCPNGSDTPRTDFMRLANCLPRDVTGSEPECMDGTAVTVRASGACPAYANMRPWSTAQAVTNAETSIAAGSTVYWRYVTKRKLNGQHYVMVHRLDKAATDPAARWVFVPRNCLADILPLATTNWQQDGIARKHRYYCPHISDGDNLAGRCVDPVININPGSAIGAQTGAATNVQSTTATLNATVSPDNLTTKVRFEFGMSTAYGNFVDSTTVSGSAQQAVSATATGLVPGTVYHYRVVATHEGCSGCPHLAYGADQTFTTAAAPPLPPRMAVLQSDGTLWTKDGALSTAWVRQTNPEIKQVALAGNRIAVIKTDGTVWTKEGSAFAVWVKQSDPDFKQVVLEGDRIAAVETSGTLWTKEGSLSNPWIRQTNAEVAQVVMDGGRVAVRKTDGTVWTKEGALDSAWVKQTDPSFKQVALEGDRLAVVETNGTLWTKEGALSNAWVRQTDAEVKYVVMDDKRIALVKANGTVWSKDGSLGGSWVMQSDGGINHVLLENGRLAAVETNGTLWTKSTLTSSWQKQTDPEVLQTEEVAQVAMEGDRLALVKTNGSVWTKEGSLSNAWVKQADPTFSQVVLSPYP